MEQLNELHTSHIGRVKVNFGISAYDLNPDEITKSINIASCEQAKRGDERKNYVGEATTPHKEGFWIISSKPMIASKDVNDHFSYLLNLLLPHKSFFAKLMETLDCELWFDVLWESSYLYAGTGPMISNEVINGLSQLNASINFDIYEIDKD